MTTQNLALVTGPTLPGNNLVKHSIDRIAGMAAASLLFMLLCTAAFAQTATAQRDESRLSISAETDPAFWVGTLASGPAIDGNIDFKVASLPGLRFGVLGSAGKWSGAFGKTVLLTDDFTGNDWTTQWNAIGIEAQYQFPLGLKRGGLQPGFRMQWNQFTYYQDNTRQGQANHLTIVPQVGFQYFPFRKLGFYVLPWAGVQLPIAGTDKIKTDDQLRDTRKLMPVVTAHLGWEFRL